MTETRPCSCQQDRDAIDNRGLADVDSGAEVDDRSGADPELFAHNDVDRRDTA